MGTKTLGSTAAGVPSHFVYYDSSTGVALRSHSNYHTSTEEMYIDAIYVYVRLHTGGPATLRHALYQASGGGVFLAEADINYSWNTTDQFTRSEFSQGNYYHVASSGINLDGAVLRPSSGGLQLGAYNDSGVFYYHTGISAFTDPFGGSAKTWGNMPWYVTYFPKATITSLPSTPQFPGATIDVYGQSFSAGVTSVTVNGIACSGVTVIDDTHLTCVLPSNATTGPVQVVTYAGTATSAGNLIVSGGRVYNGGSLKSTVSVRVFNASVLKPITRIRVYNGGVLKDAH